MLDVLFVAKPSPPGVRTGSTEAFDRLARQIEGHARIRTIGEDPAALPDAAANPWVGPGAWLKLWRQARSRIADRRPDVVVTAELGLPPLGVPIVAVVRELPGSSWGTRPPRVWLRAVARAPAVVVAPNQPIRRMLRGLGVNPWRIEVLPVGRDVPVEPAPLPPGLDPLLLIHPGPIHRARGQHVSVDAVSRLPPSYRARVRLVVAGHVADPRYLALLRDAARDQPITFAPDASDLSARIVASHVVIDATSLDARVPDHAVDALALGRPVVWPDRGSLREALHPAGLSVPPGDVAGLRSALVRLIVGADLSAMARDGQALARSRFGWTTLWPRWRTLLTAAAGR